MGTKFILSLLRIIKFQSIIILRWITFFRDKKTYTFQKDFLTIKSDGNFADSLIEIQFYFSRLLWVDFQQVGKKLYNGRIFLQANKMSFPYEISVRTFGNKNKFVIESFDAVNDFHSEKFAVYKFQSFKRQYSSAKFFRMPKLISETLKNRIYLMTNTPKISKNFPMFSEKLRITKINHQPFNSSKYYEE